VFAGPFSYNGGRVSAVETMKGPIEAIRVIIKAVRMPIAVVEVPKETVIML
jgi:hypothetical protein